MRKIEQKINEIMASVKAGVYTLSKRDKVSITIKNNWVICRYYLWESNVYTREYALDGSMFGQGFTLAGYDTPTTRSRVRALLQGGNFARKNGNNYFNGRQIDNNEVYCLNYSVEME